MLYKGDCLQEMKRIPDGSVDLTVTSPPYDNLRTYNDSLEWGEHIWKPVIEQLFRVTKDGGVVVWVVGDATLKHNETGTSFKQALFAKEIGFNLYDTMIYHRQSGKPPHRKYWQNFEYMFILTKGRPSTVNIIKDRVNKYRKGGGDAKRQSDGSVKKGNRGGIALNEYGIRENIWYYSAGKGNTTSDTFAFEHPAMFPEKLAHDHILSWSNEGDTVLDPFMGAATTGKMATLLNRQFIGIEKDDKYYDIAKKRIQEAEDACGLFKQ